jgi:hypothetical protein
MENAAPDNSIHGLCSNCHVTALLPCNAGMIVAVDHADIGRHDIARLASNESAERCSTAVIKALALAVYEPWRDFNRACTELLAAGIVSVRPLGRRQSSCCTESPSDFGKCKNGTDRVRSVRLTAWFEERLVFRRTWRGLQTGWRNIRHPGPIQARDIASIKRMLDAGNLINSGKVLRAS